MNLGDFRFPHCVGQSHAGHAVVCEVRTDSDGARSAHQVTLCNRHGPITARIEPGTPGYECFGPLAIHQIVRFQLRGEFQDGQVVATLTDAGPADLNDIPVGAEVIPCLHERPGFALMLEQLADFHAWIPNRYLSSFLTRVLLDRRLIYALPEARSRSDTPASAEKYFLAEKLSRIAQIEQLALQRFPRNPANRRVTAIAYLVHDLGKVLVQSLPASPSTETDAARLSAVLLKPHLEWLAETHLKWALQIQSVIDSFGAPLPPGFRMHYPGTDLVRAVLRPATSPVASEAVAFSL